MDTVSYPIDKPESLSGPEQRGLAIVADRLRAQESVRWSAQPSKLHLGLDLSYRAAIWWTIFPATVPLNLETLLATALIMFLLARLEYKQKKNRNFYVITNERAMLGTFTRKGDLKYIEDLELASVETIKKTPFTRTIKIKYKQGGKTRWLRFPYVKDAESAIKLLKPAQS